MKRIVSYASPKEYKKEFEIREGRPIPAKLPASRSKYCKKLKGPHQYGLWEIEHFGWEKDKTQINGFWQRFCSACSKKDIWIAPQDKSPHWRLDTTARPPGFYENL